MVFPSSLKQKSASLSSPSHPRRHLPPFTIVFFSFASFTHHHTHLIPYFSLLLKPTKPGPIRAFLLLSVFTRFPAKLASCPTVLGRWAAEGGKNKVKASFWLFYNSHFFPTSCLSSVAHSFFTVTSSSHLKTEFRRAARRSPVVKPLPSFLNSVSFSNLFVMLIWDEVSSFKVRILWKIEILGFSSYHKDY